MAYWDGKVALVTGGSAGLGAAIANRLCAERAAVMIASRNTERVEKTVAELEQLGYRAAGATADVTHEEQVAALVDDTVAKFGGLDLLVNNVGISSRGDALETSAEEFRRLMEVNLLSVVHGSRAAAPHLRQSRGHLVNIGSLASKVVSPFLGAYPATKFAVAAYTQQLRWELGPQGVHVLLVCPGPITRSDAGNRYDDQAEGLPESARQPGGGVKLRGIAPDALAAKILRACRRRQPELVVPGRARWLFAISQLRPALGDWIIQKMRS